MKEKKKLEEKLRLKALIPGDSGPMENAETGLFNLQKLSKVSYGFVESYEVTFNCALDFVHFSPPDWDL